jgi:hypothetical protein
MESFWRDVRYGLRVLAKSPGFSVLAVLTLALGIGANTAIFSILDPLLLRKLPVRNPDQRCGSLASERLDALQKFPKSRPIMPIATKPPHSRASSRFPGWPLTT